MVNKAIWISFPDRENVFLNLETSKVVWPRANFFGQEQLGSKYSMYINIHECMHINFITRNACTRKFLNSRALRARRYLIRKMFRKKNAASNKSCCCLWLQILHTSWIKVKYSQTQARAVEGQCSVLCIVFYTLPLFSPSACMYNIETVET